MRRLQCVRDAKITLQQQAQRLWGLDGQICQQLPEFLVDASCLSQPRDGMYTRTPDHRSDGRGRGWQRLVSMWIDRP